jgi:hypothetical protein
MKPRVAVALLALAASATIGRSLRAADDPQNNVVALLGAGQPALGVWTGAIPATRIAKVLAGRGESRTRPARH